MSGARVRGDMSRPLPSPVREKTRNHGNDTPPPRFASIHLVPNSSSLAFLDTQWRNLMPSATRNGGRRGSGEANASRAATGRDGTATTTPRVPSPPAPTACVSLASLAERIRELQTDPDSNAVIGELREELRAVHE